MELYGRQVGQGLNGGGAVGGNFSAPVDPRSVPMAIGAVEHGVDGLNERLSMLLKRLEDGGVLRPEPPQNESGAQTKPSLPCGLASTVAYQAERLRSLGVFVENLVNRLEV